MPEKKEAEVDEVDDIWYNLSDKELMEANRAFDDSCPQNSDEQLTKTNLNTALRSLGFEPRTDEVQQLMKKFSNKKSKISRDAFQKIVALKMSTSTEKDGHSNLPTEIARVFEMLDTEKKGFITFEDLKSVSEELNEKLTDADIQEMIEEADTDGDLKINETDFLNIMKRTGLY